MQTGQQIGAFRLGELLGIGGMGEVYRARDMKLGRDVAIKMLPAVFASDPQRLSRFTREAQLLASLNHPNIAAIHGFEDADGVRGLVLELVEGPTLAERLTRGPLPLDETLAIARQIGAALEAAHEQGIIHRDLKPANIKVREDGTVKVLDFGLAKLIAPAERAAAGAGVGSAEAGHYVQHGGSPGLNLTASPTITTPAMTTAGIILGTAAYMSPEQAKGKPADKRSDIWAFGCVLYEMLTGMRAFEAEDVAETLAAILTRAPEFDRVPRQARRLVERCLQRDPRKRLRDAGDAMLLLDDASVDSLDAPQPTGRRWGRMVAGALVTLAVGIGFGAVYGRRSLSRDRNPGVRLTIVPPDGTTIRAVGGFNSTPVVAPDGSAVAVLADDGLRLRRLDGFEMQPIRGAESISQAPFWSPDATSIAFPIFNVLRRIRLPDGAPETVTTLPTPSSVRGTWSDRGTIVIATGGDDSSLFAVAASGGEARRLETEGLSHGRYQWPQFVAHSDDFVFSFLPDGSEQVDIYLATLGDGRIEHPSKLLSNDTAARYTNAGGGRLLFVRNDNLYSQHVDRRNRKVDGDPELLVQGVASAPTANDAHFSVSETGTVVWRPGRAALSQITAFDRRGNIVDRAGPPGPLFWMRFSPDDAHAIAGGLSASLVETGQSGRRNLGPAWRLWTPDGQRLIGLQNEQLVIREVNGAGNVRPIGKVGSSALLQDVSGDGQHVVYTAGTGGSATIMSVRVDDSNVEQIPAQVVGPGEIVGHPRFSPDGRWVVFVAAPTFQDRLPGRAIFVQPFPGPGFRKQIAADGTYPVWRGDGREIIYLGNDNRIWSIATELRGTEAQFGTPQSLFAVQRPAGVTAVASPLAISRDGSRISFLQDVPQPDGTVIHVATGLVK